MKSTFFARRSLLILSIVVFFVPFVLRGAGHALQRMKNNVEDWLPADFAETAELEWFGRHFMGEQFVIVTWPVRPEFKTLDEDPRFADLVQKLSREIAPPQRTGGHVADVVTNGASLAGRPSQVLSQAEGDTLDRLRARDLGNRLGLCVVGGYFEDWGGRGEKWLLGDDDVWYFITPKGDLYRWHDDRNLRGYLGRILRRTVTGDRRCDGDLIATLGRRPTGGRPNEFHDDPRKMMARLFKSVITGPQVRDNLSRKNGALWPRGLDEEYAASEARTKAVERLSGTLFGPNGDKQTAIILTLSEPGKRDLRRVIGRPLLGRPRGRLLELAAECGIESEDLKLGGPPVDNVAIDEEGQITLARLIGLSALVGIVISQICFRTIHATIKIFFVGGVSAIASLGIVRFCGSSVDAITLSMPSLVYVLGLSGAVHIVNYYRDEVSVGGFEGAPERALSRGWKPCTLAAFTTALGLMSLNTSNLIPIRKFGFYSALGVMTTLVLLFTFLPAALQLWPVVRKDQEKKRKEPAGAKPFNFQQSLRNFWEPIGEWVVRHYGVVTAACLALFIAGLFGLPKIQTSVHLIKLFDEDSKIIRDYAWLESNMGKLVPMELVVRVRPEMMCSSIQREDSGDDERFQLNFLERMEITDRLQRVMEGTFGDQGTQVVGRGMSAPMFAPDLPAPGLTTLRNPTRGVMNRELEKHRHEYLASGYLCIDREGEHRGSELWRISLRLGALMDIDYGRFVAELKRAAEPVLTAYRYRDQILREMDRQSDGGGVLKRRVAFLGVPDPAQAPVSQCVANAHTSKPHDRYEMQKEVQTEINQTHLFTSTLRDLMTCAGVCATRDCWHDPNSIQVEGGYYTSETWGTELAEAFDCVVLVRDHKDYDVEFIKQRAKLFIDARDHGFDPSSATAKTARDRGDPIHVVYTGLVPIVYKAQRSLLVSLMESIGWAFIMIALVMMILLRNGRLRPTNFINVRGGMISMIPNALPCVLIFGAMGHLSIKVDIGTMMTASVAMGVAVDDTIHFLIWFREGTARGLSRNQAIIEAYRRCAAAMTQTTLIGGLGLAVFAFSTFTPTQCFGMMMLILLIAALLGDLVFLPALLAGPLGRYVCAPPSTTKQKLTPDDRHDCSMRSQNRSPHLPVQGSNRGQA
jgi:predicted RND superfamily exporter protein